MIKMKQIQNAGLRAGHTTDGKKPYQSPLCELTCMQEASLLCESTIPEYNGEFGVRGDEVVEVEW